MIKSRNDFYYDLSQSPNMALVHGIKFFLPSKKRLAMFLAKYGLMREKLYAVLIDKYQVDVNVDVIAAFATYAVIQPINQYVILEGGEIVKCLDSLKLDGLKPRSKNSTEM